MPFELKPLFRPEVVHTALAAAPPPAPSERALERLVFWRDRLEGDAKKGVGEASHLPQFVADLFGEVLGYRSDVDSPAAYTLAREYVNPVDGKCADAVIGRFAPDQPRRPVMVVEGKGPLDPLERPWAGRKKSAVEQAYLYAVNLSCDWIVVTNMAETRLYNKRADMRAFERFETRRLANEPHTLARFVFVLGADSVLEPGGGCRLDRLLAESERQGRDLSAQFYQDYQEIRYALLDAVREHNPALTHDRALAATQKLLDRVLFAAFCEDRGLLPADIVERAVDTVNPFVPTPRWLNFQALFRAIDAGCARLKIPLYNGGLFAADADLDALTLPDAACENFRRLAAYNFRPAMAAMEAGGAAAAAPVVDVDILGHIFEQSIDDLDRLRGELVSGDYEEKRRRQAKGGKGPSRRNLGGSFYTPAFVTRHMVDEALTPVLAERFERCRARLLADAEAREAAQPARRGKKAASAGTVLEDPRAAAAKNLTAEQRGHLANFWEAWREELQTVRILDPACGSGAFLIECFDRMAAAYGEATARLADLSGGQLALFDADATILRRNLFGVDISGEAVNICRLSLWIKTAKRDAPLTGLDDNVIQGDSLIDDPAFSARAVDFAARFPQAFEQGGFDVVIGNPPYVRQELIGDAKPFLQKRYRAFHGMADLYVYFYERGLELLRPGGRLSYVVTNKWLKAGYGEGLRGLFADSAWLESVVDFGHAKAIFPDADVFPCVVLARKPEPSAEPPTETRVCAVPRDQLRIDDLTRQTADEGFFLPRDHFGAAPWRLEPPQALALMDKIARAGAPLVEYAGTKPYRGVLTGLNEAFLIDGATRRRLIDQDPACAELIKPYLRGQDVKRWASPASDLFMIVMKSSGDHSWPWAQADNETTAEKLFAATYPSLHRWFKPWEERLRKRQDKGRYWWELRPCAYYEKFEGKMILYKDIMYNSKFSYVYDGAYVNNTVYFIESSDLHILSALSSPLMWWYTWRKFEHAKDEALRFFTDFVQALPIAPCPADARDEMAAAVERLTDIHRRKYAAAADWRDWLRLQHGLEKPGRALAMPFALTGDGVAEQVKAARGARRPLSPSDLKGLKSAVAETVEPVRALLREAEGLERRLSDIVNRAYGLDADDIALLRRTAPPRTPLFAADGDAEPEGDDDE
ncbi:MAG TPA: Eco57I restriction-modification methylase domain-containing protein [Azospirillaceae bacterium]|nr:Eco57I restriction-modification methylase domain-containing protein [Azospirillaceae bacterium]